MGKYIICIDFDGVIHDYREGWKDGTIYGRVVPGFFEWALAAKELFRLVIYSSRSSSPEGIKAMKDWLLAQWMSYTTLPGNREIEVPIFWDANGDPAWFEFADVKPPAFVTIDDRGIQFRGDWSAPELQPANIATFKPWNAR